MAPRQLVVKGGGKPRRVLSAGALEHSGGTGMSSLGKHPAELDSATPRHTHRKLRGATS